MPIGQGAAERVVFCAAAVRLARGWFRPHRGIAVRLLLCVYLVVATASGPLARCCCLPGHVARLLTPSVENETQGQKPPVRSCCAESQGEARSGSRGGEPSREATERQRPTGSKKCPTKHCPCREGGGLGATVSVPEHRSESPSESLALGAESTTVIVTLAPDSNPEGTSLGSSSRSAPPFAPSPRAPHVLRC